MGLFRETGRVRPHVFLLFTFTFKALQDQALVLFPTSPPPHPCSHTPRAGAIFLLPEPSYTSLLPLYSLFLLPGRLLPIDLYRMDSLLLLKSQLQLSLASLNGEAPSILLIFLFSDHDCIPIIIFDFPDGSFANVSYFTNYCKF